MHMRGALAQQGVALLGDGWARFELFQPKPDLDGTELSKTISSGRTLPLRKGAPIFLEEGEEVGNFAESSAERERLVVEPESHEPQRRTTCRGGPSAKVLDQMITLPADPPAGCHPVEERQDGANLLKAGRSFCPHAWQPAVCRQFAGILLFPEQP